MSYLTYNQSAVIGVMNTVTGNSGGAVGPDAAHNTNLVGTGAVTVTGTPITNTLTISIAGATVPEGGTGLTTITDHSLVLGSGVAAMTELGVATNGQLVIGSTGADPVLATLTSIGGTIAVTNAAGSINLDAIPTAIGVTQLDGDTGTGTPLLGVVDVLGSANITTLGALNDLTITLDLDLEGMTGVEFASGGSLLTDTGAGDTFFLEAYDVDGAAYVSFATLTANNTPTMDLSDDVTKAGGYIYRAGGTVVAVADGGTGTSSLTDHGILLGSGTAAVTALGAAADGQIPIGSTGLDPVIANITSSGGSIAITNGAGTINIETGAGVLVGLDGDTGSSVPTAGIIIVEGGNNITTSAVGTNILTVALDSALTSIASITMQNGGSVRSGTGIADTALLQAYDVDGTAYVTFATLTANNTPTMDLEDTVTKAGQYIYRASGTDVPVTDGGTGVSTLTDHGIMLGSGTSPVTVLGAATDGQLVIGSTGLDPVIANITSVKDLTVTNGAGTLNIDLTDNTHDTAIHGWNAAIIESPVVTVTSDGVTITFSVERSGTGDLTVVFSDGFYAWDTTPADTIALTAGTDTSPQINYVYMLQSTKVLTVSTASWPATEHAPLATVICQSAASLQTYGAYKMHAWTDHVTGSNDQGHISHLNFWIRGQNATYESGVAQTLTITPNGGAPDNVIFTTSAGVVLQLHDHTFPAFAGTPDVYTINDSVTPYNRVTDLNALLTDSSGGSMSGRYFALVIWGVVSEATGDCKLMVNLPSGTYGTSATLGTDLNKYTDYTIPSDFKGTGFLISQLNLRHQVTASGTWTSIDEIDLRGLFPAISAGGTTSFPTDFPDNTFRIFDNADNTKEIAFEASAITTATTRTITAADRDIDLAEIADSFVTPSGTAVPASGVLTFANGTNVTMTAAGSTITVNSTGGGSGGITWSILTSDLDPMVVDTGYIANKAGLLSMTLPATAAVGTVQRVTGMNTDVGWRIVQRASQQIHFGDLSTTSGVGGYLESTIKRDSVELVCVVANLEWNILSSLGNVTIV